MNYEQKSLIVNSYFKYAAVCIILAAILPMFYNLNSEEPSTLTSYLQYIFVILIFMSVTLFLNGWILNAGLPPKSAPTPLPEFEPETTQVNNKNKTSSSPVAKTSSSAKTSPVATTSPIATTTTSKNSSSIVSSSVALTPSSKL